MIRAVTTGYKHHVSELFSEISTQFFNNADSLIRNPCKKLIELKRENVTTTLFSFHKLTT